jgi:thioredoxin reductase (NADPH)
MPKYEEYDLLIVGAGPAGLSAVINAESERINTLVLDGNDHLGGQASESSLIENYPGFPGGVSGAELTGLMIEQAIGFKAELLAPWHVQNIRSQESGLFVTDGSEEIFGRSVLLASGVQYNRLVVPNIAAYLGRGIEYGSPDLGIKYEGKKLFVVGGANSAGQAAMHLSKMTDCSVDVLIRGNSIEDKMSAYLHERIAETPNINVRTETEITGVAGNGRLKELTLKVGNEELVVPADEVFIFIGAEPKTHWLSVDVERDEKGYIKAGGDIGESGRREFVEVNGRPPLPHETSVPGLFVAGDVRCGTTKRVASAVGDGATTVPDLHRYFAILASK